jgi:hypothetical protein
MQYSMVSMLCAFCAASIGGGYPVGLGGGIPLDWGGVFFWGG